MWGPQILRIQRFVSPRSILYNLVHGWVIKKHGQALTDIQEFSTGVPHTIFLWLEAPKVKFHSLPLHAKSPIPFFWSTTTLITLLRYWPISSFQSLRHLPEPHFDTLKMSAARSPETSQQLTSTTQRNYTEYNKFKPKSLVTINCLQREIRLSAKFNTRQILQCWNY